MIKENAKEYILKNGERDILIHSDLLYGFKTRFESRNQFLEDQYSILKDICNSLNIIMPTFNYDFCRGADYNLRLTDSQVGTLSEYFRKNIATWRTSTPVFNFAGIGKNPLIDLYGAIDPFDGSSLFAYLYNNKGLLMHYGSGFHTTTLIHYVERISNVLIYRYDKIFRGKVIDFNNNNYKCDLKYHVRPMGLNLNYDWDKIENDLIKNNIIVKYKQNRTQIILGRIDRIVDHWLKRLNDNKFYLLDTETFSIVQNIYNELERPFELSDFE